MRNNRSGSIVRAGMVLLCLAVGGQVPDASAAKLRDLYRRVAPAVCMIQTLQTDIVPGTAAAEPQYATSGGVGSGVLITKDGMVLTAAHVVQSADAVAAVFMDGEIIPAAVIASSAAADVALIKLERLPDDAVVARLGDSDKMQIGDQVFVVGTPYGLQHTLTVGYISYRHTQKGLIGNLEPIELFQTDAAINVGNSGGPLFNLDGEVVGVVSHIMSRSGGSDGLGFAVTSRVARHMLLERKAVWTGIDFYPLAGELAKVFNLPQSAGLLVQRVADRSPAAVMGLRPGTMRARIEDHEMLVGGDIILAVAGIPVCCTVDDGSRIMPVLEGLDSGEVLRVKVLREGVVQELSYTKP